MTDLRCCRLLYRPVSIAREVSLVTAALFVVLLSTSALGAQQAPTEIEPGTCLADGCHAALEAKQTIHHPVRQGPCEACHMQDDEKVHKFETAEATAELCYMCHDSVTQGKKLMHEPLKETDENACLYCHDPHSSDASALLNRKTAAQLCLSCHADMAAEDALHQSEDQTCTDCHEPHASDNASLLRTPPPGLCYKCHSDIREKTEKSEFVHGPAAAGCAACHNPHRALAGKGLPATGEKLCMMCHGDFKETLEAMSARHPQLLSGAACGRCHEPHAGRYRHMLRDTSVALCLACHGKEIKTQDGRTVPSLAGFQSPDMALHGPLSAKQCAPCHRPHGGPAKNFLAGAYPAGFYSHYKDEAYELCFGCHGSELANEAETTTATAFRDAARNLHYVHVHKERKGRSCRACHLPHGGKNLHFLADTVPFGNWQLPIGFTPTEEGGTCQSGCHAEKHYSRGLRNPADETGNP